MAAAAAPSASAALSAPLRAVLGPHAVALLAWVASALTLLYLQERSSAAASAEGAATSVAAAAAAAVAAAVAAAEGAAAAAAAAAKLQTRGWPLNRSPRQNLNASL